LTKAVYSNITRFVVGGRNWASQSDRERSKLLNFIFNKNIIFIVSFYMKILCTLEQDSCILYNPSPFHVKPVSFYFNIVLISPKSLEQVSTRSIGEDKVHPKPVSVGIPCSVILKRNQCNQNYLVKMIFQTPLFTDDGCNDVFCNNFPIKSFK